MTNFIKKLIDLIKRHPFTFIFRLIRILLIKVISIPLYMISQFFERFIKRYFIYDMGHPKGITLRIAYFFHKLGIKYIILSKKLILFATPHTSKGHVKQKIKAFTKLHKNIDQEIKKQSKEYKNYKYFWGYPYQALNLLNVFGWRNTEERYDNYEISKYTNFTDTLLDIGCNCGFFGILASYRTGCKVEGYDINPYMINIGKHCVDHLKLNEKIELMAVPFQENTAANKYNVILSFAAHYTNDKQHRPDFFEFMKKLHTMLQNDGTLIFESHYHDIGDPEFEKAMSELKAFFSWSKPKMFENNTRQLFIMKKISK
jgi:SAM-dependent methyltransferase